MIEPTMTPIQAAWCKYNLLISDIKTFAAGLQDGAKFTPGDLELLNHRLGFALKELEAQGMKRCWNCGCPACKDCKEDN